jgi:cytochrome P450
VTLRGLKAAAAYARYFRDPIDCMAALHRRYGRLFAIGEVLPVGHERLHFMAADPEINRQVFSDPETFLAVGLVMKGPQGSAQNRLRRGLVGMHGRQHKHYRALFMPPFRRPNIAGYVGQMDEIIAAELTSWPLEQPVDLWPLAKRMVRRIAVRILFGGRQAGDEAERIADRVDRFMNLSAWDGLRSLPIDLPGTPYRRMLRYAQETEEAILAWADKRRGQSQDGDLLAILVNQNDHRGKTPSPTTISGQIPVLFGASYETCQTALTWTLFLLAQHPPMAERLVEELRAAGDKEPAYLEWVVKESMRLYTPVPYQARRAARDTELLGMPVPANSRVFIAALLTNRNPALYLEANSFRPERWENFNPSAYEYLTFSAGPRACIGVWFGMTVVKRALTAILRHATVEVQPDARIERYSAVTLRPVPGVPIILHPPGSPWRANRVRGRAPQLLTLFR